MRSLFVSGTDTDIGKTFVSSLILRGVARSQKVTYFKPVQSGSPWDCDTVAQINPDLPIKKSTYCFQAAASPDRAAALEAKEISIEAIIEDWHSRDSSLHVVEGAGGLCVPLNDDFLMVDLIGKLELPCLLVTSTRLGTINHTLLSIQTLKAKNVPIVGIVLNGEQDPGLKELLEEKTSVPVVFEVPKFESRSLEELDAWMVEDPDFLAFVDWLIMSKPAVEPTDKLEKLDQEFSWHPFTQHGIVKKHPLVRSASGSFLNIDNQKVIDGISSWWVNLLGHCHPEIADAISVQAKKLEHVIFAGFSHEPAARLSQSLVSLARRQGACLDKVFYSDNGSTAVEVALKMAFQYHRQSGQNLRSRFLAFRGSYHGDTLGAMSVGERKGFSEVFQPLMFDVDFVDPFDRGSLRQAFEKNGDRYAAVIVEPMVQGASGMRMYGADLLNELQSLCDQYSVLKICDEVFTGFYRTGRCFAFEHSQLKPDFLCLSKGLTGGFLPLAVTLTAKNIFEHFSNDDMRKAFLHGHSYTANPLACEAANATLKILERSETQEKIKKIEDWTKEFVEEISQSSHFFNSRYLGTIGAVEVSDEDPNYFKGDFSYRINQAALQAGVLLRPLGGTIYSVPPYCIEKEELKKVYQTMKIICEREF